jgi:hypothetical protein
MKQVKFQILLAIIRQFDVLWFYGRIGETTYSFGIM